MSFHLKGTTPTRLNTFKRNSLRKTTRLKIIPEREKKPIAQKVQLEDPELLWYFPPAHSVHVLEATLAE